MHRMPTAVANRVAKLDTPTKNISWKRLLSFLSIVGRKSRRQAHPTRFVKSPYKDQALLIAPALVTPCEMQCGGGVHGVCSCKPRYNNVRSFIAIVNFRHFDYLALAARRSCCCLRCYVAVLDCSCFALGIQLHLRFCIFCARDAAAPAKCTTNRVIPSIFVDTAIE